MMLGRVGTPRFILPYHYCFTVWPRFGCRSIDLITTGTTQNFSASLLHVLPALLDKSKTGQRVFRAPKKDFTTTLRPFLPSLQNSARYRNVGRRWVWPSQGWQKRKRRQTSGQLWEDLQHRQRPQWWERLSIGRFKEFGRKKDCHLRPDAKGAQQAYYAT